MLWEVGMPNVAEATCQPDTTFWVTEPTYANGSIVVHTSWCRVCNNGHGPPNFRYSTGGSLKCCWHGPFTDFAKASGAARQLAAALGQSPRLCGHCLDVSPFARKRPSSRYLPDIDFLVKLANDGEITVHTSLCPTFLYDTLTVSPSREDGSMAAGTNALWYGPYHRLAESMSKVEAFILSLNDCRRRQCMKCGRNGRLQRIDDRIATSFAYDKTRALVLPEDEIATVKQIICLECGRGRVRFISHLRKEHGITPEMYRQKWNLAANSPMVPPGYRRQIARSLPTDRIDVSDEALLESANVVICD